MAVAVLTSKGQVTIPVSVRTALGLGTGDRIEFVETENGQFAVMAATKSVKSLKGIIPATRSVSIEEMNAAIATQGAAAR
ncbi:MAG TPA: AbrB/MazE/SpoVT family DNA-binding domain-containing protein [Rhodospirillaceae bacterium]|nr:AbrB/MazE/SpoVT family DNA-binding domain-containing protein [Rhodospirillaceae bacterium]